MHESLRDEIERLHAEITITEQKLGAVDEETRKQHNTFLRGLLPTDRLLQKTKEAQLEVTFQKTESALTRVELAAQQLVAPAHSDTPTDVASTKFGRSGLGLVSLRSARK
jgi:hypothetical protein